MLFRPRLRAQPHLRERTGPICRGQKAVLDGAEGDSRPGEGNEPDLRGGAFATDAWYVFILPSSLSGLFYDKTDLSPVIVVFPMMISSSELDDGSIQILRDSIDELLLCVFPCFMLS